MKWTKENFCIFFYLNQKLKTEILKLNQGCSKEVCVKLKKIFLKLSVLSNKSKQNKKIPITLLQTLVSRTGVRSSAKNIELCGSWSLSKFSIFRWDTHLYMPLFPSVRPSIRPSVRPSVAQHISGTVHHLIIIFGTRM